METLIMKVKITPIDAGMKVQIPTGEGSEIKT
jgi:hypothetical protein